MARKKQETEPAAEALTSELLEQMDQVQQETPTALTIPGVCGEEAENPIPDINSLEWTPFILSKLKEDEVWDGFPTVEGLRRVTTEYLGEVIESYPRVVQAPNMLNGFHTCVEYHLAIRFHADNTVRHFGGAADTYAGNCDPEYARYASTCDTRSESKAYRRALRLRHVCTAEEICNIPVEDSGASGFITRTQINTINSLASRCNINVVELIRDYKSRRNVKDAWGGTAKIPYQHAQRIFGELMEYQRVPNAVPAKLLGYDPTWND